jgi:Uma2 family endonuclease
MTTTTTPAQLKLAPLSSVLPLQMSDEEFLELCRRLEPMDIEITKEGTIRMMMAAGNDSSRANAIIIGQLYAWWNTHKRGSIYDSDTRFTLPDGSKLGPDAAYITDERLAKAPKGFLFGRVCPNFVIELLSATDSEKVALKKMQDWVTNGVEVAWLIDLYKRVSYSFGQREYTTGASELHGVGPVEGFTLDLIEVWNVFTP